MSQAKRRRGLGIDVEAVYRGLTHLVEASLDRKLEGVLVDNRVYLTCGQQTAKLLDNVGIGLVDGSALPKTSDAPAGLDVDPGCGRPDLTGAGVADEERAASVRGEMRRDGKPVPIALSPEEAYFLAGVLRILDVSSASQQPAGDAGPGDEHPSGAPHHAQDGAAHTRERTLGSQELLQYFVHRDPHFCLRMAAYRHFRAEGWIVRSGVLYGADFVLYPAHPRSSHSSYTVIVPRPDEALEGGACAATSALSIQNWSALQASSRVSQQVGKRLLLAFVSHPSPHGDVPPGCDPLPAAVDGERFVSEAAVDQVVYQRWSAKNTIVQ
ncbi:unnamed protein product [Pedinophyceae sp. YPF-701]|nr:unnamed protein product [Pedinophyceae sp. YPF-701]